MDRDILGAVVPEEMLRDNEIKTELKALTKNVRIYSVYPFRAEMHFALIYEEVQKIYKEYGLL